MLILTRRLNEAIMIGPDVVVRVMAVNGQQVRIGIEAPKEIHVLREELYTRENGNDQTPQA
jgi:carbon storage regulator